MRRRTFTPEELKTCMRVLSIVSQQGDESDAPPEVEEARQQLGAIAKAAHRRNRRKERASTGEAAASGRPAQAAAPPPPTEVTAEGVVRVPAAFLSRPLYPNPVCLLASRRPRGGAVNLMTISWLTAVDNAGGFVCSMNQNLGLSLSRSLSRSRGPNQSRSPSPSPGVALTQTLALALALAPTRFVCSMNQSRHTASILASNRVLGLG